mmetsp:Transcript_5909/g.12971  ORF Transcript_5909/g.12971 Transcript_5909/m.12971 type:complete len:277 (+) Transcript_5909:92-922(+)
MSSMILGYASDVTYLKRQPLHAVRRDRRLARPRPRAAARPRRLPRGPPGRRRPFQDFPRPVGELRLRQRRPDRAPHPVHDHPSRARRPPDRPDVRVREGRRPVGGARGEARPTRRAGAGVAVALPARAGAARPEQPREGEQERLHLVAVVDVVAHRPGEEGEVAIRVRHDLRRELEERLRQQPRSDAPSTVPPRARRLRVLPRELLAFFGRLRPGRVVRRDVVGRRAPEHEPEEGHQRSFRDVLHVVQHDIENVQLSDDPVARIRQRRGRTSSQYR